MALTWPSVQIDLKKGMSGGTRVTSCPLWCNTLDGESNDSSLVDLLHNFFEYFTLFDFKNNVRIVLDARFSSNKLVYNHGGA